MKALSDPWYLVGAILTAAGAVIIGTAVGSWIAR